MAIWSFFDLIDEASKYSSRASFAKHASGAYRAALRFGMMDSLYPNSAGNERTAKRLSRALAAAKLMNDPARFRSVYPAEARLLHRHGYRNDGTKL